MRISITQFGLCLVFYRIQKYSLQKCKILLSNLFSSEIFRVFPNKPCLLQKNVKYGAPLGAMNLLLQKKQFHIWSHKPWTFSS